MTAIRYRVFKSIDGRVNLRIRAGLDRSAKTVPHPLADTDENAEFIIRSVFQKMQNAWPEEYIKPDGRLILPPKDVFHKESLKGINRNRLNGGLTQYVQNFPPQTPDDPEIVRIGNAYYLSEYFLKEHQV